MVEKNAKVANQAWRKKPRKFAPKSRLGCRTCKIRRIKCDLARPSCSKCQSTGRICDGYNEVRTHEMNKEKPTWDNLHHPPTAIAPQAWKWRNVDSDIPLQNPGPLMILPTAESFDTTAMAFFEWVSIDQLDEYQPCDSWRKTLMFFSQTVPSVRCAATALALMHRNYHDRGSGDLTSKHPDEAPWLHYNRAIGLLLKDNKTDSVTATAITLLVCYLFICFDHLTGNDVQAAKHLRGGVGILRNLDIAVRTGGFETDGGAVLLGVRELIGQVTRLICRLDKQAAMFLVDWHPTDLQETHLSSQVLSVAHGAFWSLDQASQHLQTLLARIMRLRWMDQQQVIPLVEIGPAPWPPKDSIRRQLRNWANLLKNMPRKASSNSERHLAADSAVESLLRLQYTIASILLDSHGPERELGYDVFLPQFQLCVSLAEEVHAKYYAGTVRPTFKPEIGILPVLYIIGAKCRHPVVRREVLRILGRKPIREAAWDSVSLARILERVIAIEEGSCAEEQQGVRQSMPPIPVDRRIEALSWIHDVNGTSVAKVHLHYTFCMREGVHSESLIV